jgi:phage terminase small subunit
LSNRKLLTRERIFVAEYLLDHDANAAADRAGYPNGAWGKRVLRKQAVRRAIAEEEEKQRARLAVTPENIMTELAKVAFSNGRDFFPGKGQTLDLQQLDVDKTAAIQDFQLDEQIDPNTGQIYRRTRVKLYDKNAALRDLARCIGMMREEHVLTIEHKIKSMTPQERVDLAQELIEEGRKYLPEYRQALAAGEIVERKVVEGEVAEVKVEKGPPSSA